MQAKREREQQALYLWRHWVKNINTPLPSMGTSQGEKEKVNPLSLKAVFLFILHFYIVAS